MVQMAASPFGHDGGRLAWLHAGIVHWCSGLAVAPQTQRGTALHRAGVGECRLAEQNAKNALAFFAHGTNDRTH